MTGVEILATEEVATAFGFNFHTYFLIIALCSFTICLICGLMLLDDYGAWSFLISLVIGVVLGCLLGLPPASNSLPTEYKTQYKVTISDEVSMNDFLERYEIIEQEGKIYTVREIKDGK